MTESKSLSSEGVLTFWSCARFTDRADLLARLERSGLLQYCPEARSPQSALRDALEEVFPTRTHRVEPLKSRSAFEVISVARGEEQNEYNHLTRVSIDDQLAVEVKPFDHITATNVVAAFNKHRGLVRADQVTRSLIAYLQHVGGLRLRQEGSVYWIPKRQLYGWREIAECVEGAATQGNGNRVYIISHAMGPDEVRAVQDGLINEIVDETNRIRREIQSGKLKERALEARQEEAMQLRDKITMYEGILRTGLSELLKTVDDVEMAATDAVLLLAAGAPTFTAEPEMETAGVP